ncbi:MAG: o-succinylbenzoate synthase [Caldilineaceae bacterium]
MIHFSLHPHTFHFKRPARTSRGDLEVRNVWFVRVWREGQPDVFGLGECGPVPGLSVDVPDLPQLNSIEDDLSDDLSQAIQASGVDRQRYPALAFAVECALLDLQQGGRRVLFDTGFVRGEFGLPTHGLIWMDSAEGVLKQINNKVAQGYSVIKMKVGALPFAEELALLKEVRTRHPKVELRLDANGAFSAEDALSCLEQLAPLNVAFLEQPIRAGQWQTMAEICRQSPIPIGLDEELIGAENPTAWMETIRPQHLVLKPTLLGGLTACEEWMRLCSEIGCQWWINSLLESNVGLNAICQWTSSLDDVRIHGLGTGQLFTDNVESPLRLIGNQLWYGKNG